MDGVVCLLVYLTGRFDSMKRMRMRTVLEVNPCCKYLVLVPAPEPQAKRCTA